MEKSELINNVPITVSDKYSTRKFWLRAFGIYILAEAIYWVIHYFSTQNSCADCLRPAAFYIAQWLLTLLFTSVLWYGLHQFNNRSTWLILFMNLAVFAIHYYLWLLVYYYLLKNGPAWLVGKRHQGFFREFIYSSWFDIGKYVLKLTAFYMLNFYVEYRQAEKRRHRLAVLNKDLQLNLLKQQLSPHFYFNTLNNLYGLARRNNKRLPGALQQLQNIMQYVIIECNRPKVALQKEIDFLQSYIALEKLRYEKNTNIDMQVEGTANGYSVIPMLLIQFVENAFKHGMKEKSEENWMRVKMLIAKAQLTFIVENSFYTLEATEGIGLASVRQRLHLQYEGNCDLQLVHGDGRFSVTLKLNIS